MAQRGIVVRSAAVARSIAACLVLFGPVLSTQGKAANRLVGVWKLVEVTQADGTKITNPLPSLLIFTAKYYTMLYATSDKPRQLMKNPQQPTDAETIAAYDTVIANSGTYEISGSTVIMHVVVAKLPNLENMSSTFTLDAGTLTTTQRTQNGRPIPNPGMLKFSRAE